MRTYLQTLLTLGTFLTVIIANAQPTLQWQKNYGGAGNDSAYSIKQTTDGGYIVAGQSNSTSGDVTGNHGGADYWVAKLDAAGNIMWQKSYGGSGTDIAKCIQQTADGGYIIIGSSNSVDGDVKDHKVAYTKNFDNGAITYLQSVDEPWIIKLNSAGTITWSRTDEISDGDSDDYASHFWFVRHYASTIIQTSDGGYLFGVIVPSPEKSMNAPRTVLRKLTSTGHFAWEREQVYGEKMDITAIIENSTGYIVAGDGDGHTLSAPGFGDLFLYKTDFNGELIWSSPFEIYGNKIYSLQNTSDGGFIVAGVTGSNGTVVQPGNHGGNDYYLAKFDNAGTLMWSKCFGGPGSDIARSVQQTADGGYVIAGSSSSGGGQVTDHTTGFRGQTDYWIVKTDNMGNFLWGKSYGGSANDDAWSLVKTSDGNLMVAGTSRSSDAGFTNKSLTDFWLLKLNICGAVGLPITTAYQSFCSGSNARVSGLSPNGINLKWYNTPAGITPLAPSTLLSNGTYYVSQTTNLGCESGRASVIVAINTTPLPYAPATQSFSACNFPKIANLTAAGTSLKWYNVLTGGAPLASSTSLVSGYYYVTQTSTQGCESDRKAVSVFILQCGRLSQKSSMNNLTTEKKVASITASVYPNPSSYERVTVSINTPIDSNNAIIQVLDLKGKILLVEKAVNNKGHIQKSIDVSKLPFGVYIIRYITGDQSWNMRLVIAN